MYLGLNEDSPKPLIKFAVFLLVILAFIWVGKIFHIDARQINDNLKSIPVVYSGLVFLLLYILGTFFVWYLKDPLKVVGAIVFGAYVSTLLIYISEIINSWIFFHLSEFLGRDYVERRMGGKFKEIYEKVGDIDLGWIFLLRAVPLVAFRVLDLIFGLSKLPYKKYFWAVVLASLPRIFWIQFILAAIGNDLPLLDGINGHNAQASFSKIIGYFQTHGFMFAWSLVYFVLALIAVFKIKKEIRPKVK